MKHTPPPLVFPASVVLSIRKTEKLSDGVTAVSGTEPCFSQTKDVTVPNVPLETNPGSKIVHLILQGLDISEQNTWKRTTVSPFSQSVSDSSAVSRGVSFASWDYSDGLCSTRCSEVSPMATLDLWIKCPESG